MSATARTCLALCLPALLAVAAPASAQTVSLNQGGQPRTIAVGDAASLPPGFPEDVDYTIMQKLQPALGDGFAGPEAVAGVVAMLASDDGAFITGTEIRVDGGTHY